MIKIFNVTVFGVVGETDGVKSLSVMEGESVTLQTCVSEILRDDLIVWRFGDKGILLAKIDVETNKTSLNEADERFRERMKLDQTGSLTITNTRTEHSGLYELQIRGSESSQRFLLSVTAVPDPGLSPGVVAGIVVAVLLVAAVLSSVVIYYRRKISKLEVVTKVYVADGDSAILETGTVLQKDYEMKWYYLHDNDLIAEIKGVTKKPHQYAGLDKRFRSKLVLDGTTGSLTINNIMPIHSGLYILEMISKTRKAIKRFILTVEMKTELVKEGEDVTLEIENIKHTGDLILWTFGPENCLVVKADSTTSISERFKDRLELDHKTGSLIIRNIRNTDSGHFKLQIINSKQTTFRRFNVTVTGPTGEHLNDSMTAEMPLLVTSHAHQFLPL